MPRSTPLLIALLLTPSWAWGQECFQEVTSDRVDDVLEAAEAAYGEGDEVGFEASIQESSAFVVPCMAEVVTQPVAARLHRVVGLRAFLGKEEARWRPALTASRFLDPDGTWAESVLPSGHALRVALGEMAPTPPRTKGVPPPKVGAFFFDGVDTLARPVDRPTLLQIADDDGRIVRTMYLHADEGMPAYDRKPVLRTALAVTSGVTAAAFAGLFGGGSAVRGAYFQTDPADDAALDQQRSIAAGLGGTGIAFGIVAVGTGIAAAVVGPR